MVCPDRWPGLAAHIRVDGALGSYRLNMKWSWLQNPAVTLIGLLASVIAVVQWVASLCRYIYRLQTEAENERHRRVRIAVALAALVIVVAFSAITWPVLIAEVAKAGDHGFMGVLDVLEFAFLGLFAAQTLLKEARAQQRFSMFACALLFITLATVATGYIFSSGSTAWIGSATTSSAANLGIVTLICMFFQYERRIRAKQAKAQ
jgi:cytochrome bd-type quinol oxidase subunit 2